jgi:hypothetical protein
MSHEWRSRNGVSTMGTVKEPKRKSEASEATKSNLSE